MEELQGIPPPAPIQPLKKRKREENTDELIELAEDKAAALERAKCAEKERKSLEKKLAEALAKVLAAEKRAAAAEAKLSVLGGGASSKAALGVSTPNDSARRVTRAGAAVVCKEEPENTE